jgi:hypothetical protein
MSGLGFARTPDREYMSGGSIDDDAKSRLRQHGLVHSRRNSTATAVRSSPFKPRLLRAPQRNPCLTLHWLLPIVAAFTGINWVDLDLMQSYLRTIVTCPVFHCINTTTGQEITPPNHQTLLTIKGPGK